MKVIMFDADGTLYDINVKKCYEKMLKEISLGEGIDLEELTKEFYSSLEFVKTLQDPEKRKREYLISLVLEKFQVKTDVKKYLEIFWNCIEENIREKKGIREFLEKVRGKYKLVVFSEEFRENLVRKLKKLKLLENFDLVTPEDTKTMKPSEKFYELVKEKFKPDEILIIGDSWIRDLEIGRKFGKTVLISEKLEGTPDIWVKDFVELMEKMGDEL